MLTTYVKFQIGNDPHSPVYAAIWLKTSRRLIVGLALPEPFEGEGLGPAPPGTTYKGLTKYFTVERGGTLPKALADWGRLAHQTAITAQPAAGLNTLRRAA